MIQHVCVNIVCVFRFHVSVFGADFPGLVMDSRFSLGGGVHVKVSSYMHIREDSYGTQSYTHSGILNL